jgi:hypothetical protein
LEAYQAALERLADDPAAYAAAQAACAQSQPMFYDRSLGWETAVRCILTPLRQDRAATIATRDNPLRGAGDSVPPNVPEPEPVSYPAASDNRDRPHPALRQPAPPVSRVR